MEITVLEMSLLILNLEYDNIQQVCKLHARPKNSFSVCLLPLWVPTTQASKSSRHGLEQFTELKSDNSNIPIVCYDDLKGLSSIGTTSLNKPRPSQIQLIRALRGQY